MHKFYEFFNPVLEVMAGGDVYSRTDVSEKVAVLDVYEQDSHITYSVNSQYFEE